MEKSSQVESIRAERIKTILKIEDLTQVDLADALQMEPQNVSRFLRSGKVSEKTCRKINALYPQYRLQWLLGLDDDMNFTEMVHNYADRAEAVNMARWTILNNAFREVCEREGLDPIKLDDVSDRQYFEMASYLAKQAEFIAWRYIQPNKQSRRRSIF